MRFLFPTLILFLFLPNVILAQKNPEKTSLQIIIDAVESGAITDDDAMDLKIKILSGEALPDPFRSTSPIKCGFSIAAETKDYLKTHPEKRLRLEKKATQAVFNHSFINKNGQTKTFRINYDVSGPDAVPSVDLNSNTIPDWVEETGIACEHSYRLEVDTMGYREPLSFSAFGYYEVFILNLGDTYGYTETVTQVSSNPDTYTSAIYIENDYVEGFYTHGYDALRVTVGHEFFHAIQFSYNFRFSDAWYYELSSTWMEDVTYDDVNDYYAYLPGYFNSPNTSLDATDGYSAAHWNHMIEKKYGRGVIKKSWEYMPTRNAITSIDDAIKDTTNSSSNLSKNFSEFAIWNYYTAGRADSINYFPEAAHYPKIKLLSSRAILDTVIQRSVPTLAANYYSFHALDTTYCEIHFDASQSNSNFDFYTIEYNKTMGKNILFNHGSSSVIAINNLMRDDTLLCVVVNKVMDKNLNNNYSYSLSLSIKQDEIKSDPITDFYFYPSPFVLKSGSDKMNFKFILGKTSQIEFKVYSISGKMLRKINYGEFGEGPYDGNGGLYWDGKDADGHFVPSGVYIYQFTGNGFKKTGKIAVVR